MSDGRTAAPLVSVAIANLNGGRFLEAAIGSALAQDLGELEVIVVDDASDDGSDAIADRLARTDARVRLARLAVRKGPGGARNHALDIARGRWLAVLDNDDLMHPERLGRLLRIAGETHAQIVADDQLIFHELGDAPPQRFLGGRRAKGASLLTAETFAEETRLYARCANLGYLKPLIEIAAWRASGVRYDETLAIGEDQDLLLRLLVAGLTCRVEPSIGYFYRRHPQSSSHRLSRSALAAMASAHDRVADAIVEREASSLRRAMSRRRASIATAQAFSASVDALKRRRAWSAAAAIVRRPQAALLYRMPIAAAVSRALAALRHALAVSRRPQSAKSLIAQRPEGARGESPDRNSTVGAPPHADRILRPRHI